MYIENTMHNTCYIFVYIYLIAHAYCDNFPCPLLLVDGPQY